MTQYSLLLEGFNFEDLLTAEGLQRLDHYFCAYLHQCHEELAQQLIEYRQKTLCEPLAVSQFIIQCAPFLEAFIVQFFKIESEFSQLQAQTLSHDPIFKFKRHFILRLAKRQTQTYANNQQSFQDLDQWLSAQLVAHHLTYLDRELAIAQYGLSLLEQDPAAVVCEIEQLTAWCVSALVTPEGKEAVATWPMFTLPKRLDFNQLVDVVAVPHDPFARLQGKKFRHRQGFELTDQRMSQRQVMNEVHYCIYCHEHLGDFCSRGFPVKKSDPAQGFKSNPLGELLTGCPLEEKISEMHVLKKAGHDIAALATIMIDNPMCPATGHRICNDCMKACIYQKQTPVDIPQTETRILTDVLNLPWGVEIYDLLTRWNPLRATQWVLQPYNSLKVLVIGMGPAGFTLAHHLLMEGYAVTGVDGLKIEPLPAHWQTQPIYCWQELQESLADRIVHGFGGVAEYGITVRWDKNFLKLIYLSLARRRYFQVMGSIRFGGTLTIEDAWQLGFDHVAVAVGAGLPKELNIPNSLAPGMRQANDFLMALQLSGAAKSSSLANLQVRLPAVVIGGGLTGVDTATEVQAYYLAQVEKIAKRYHALVSKWGETLVRARFDAANLLILDEFLGHAQQLIQERALAKQEQRLPDWIALLRRWGGVTIVYRQALVESPAYRRNSEELQKALEEGIYYAEGLEPQAVLLDVYGHVRGLTCARRVCDESGVWQQTEEHQLLPARSIFVATGARLNVAYEFEHRGTFVRRNTFEYQCYERVEQQLQALETLSHVKSAQFGPFTSYQNQQRYVSFVGDTHPVFHGSVVKAIASAKRTYPHIHAVLAANNRVGEWEEYQQFRQRFMDLFKTEILSIKTLAPGVTELMVYAPMAASKLAPGQFYRVQNYEQLSSPLKGTLLQTEALALMPIRMMDQPDSLIFIVLHSGVSTRLLAKLQAHEPIALMGPAGAALPLRATSEAVMVIGSAMAAIFLLSWLSAQPQAETRVIFIACFAENEPIFYRERLQQLAHVVWIPQDQQSALMETAVDYMASPPWLLALQHLARGGAKSVSLAEIKHCYVIGSAALLQEVHSQWQKPVMQALFAKDLELHGSVYGPMQCMLKGVCAQCLQWQIDPVTGERTKAVYACSWQHQPLNKIDIKHIDQRLTQNQCQEILSNAWLDYIEEAKLDREVSYIIKDETSASDSG